MDHNKKIKTKITFDVHLDGQKSNYALIYFLWGMALSNKMSMAKHNAWFIDTKTLSKLFLWQYAENNF